MKRPKEKYLKGAVHGFLALVAATEVPYATTRLRKLLLGAAIGWHLHATFYHLALEKDKKKA
jgi:hypothetical protein